MPTCSKKYFVFILISLIAVCWASCVLPYHTLYVVTELHVHIGTYSRVEGTVIAMGSLALGNWGEAEVRLKTVANMHLLNSTSLFPHALCLLLVQPPVSQKRGAYTTGVDSAGWHGEAS